jgi:hypothetical protein
MISSNNPFALQLAQVDRMFSDNQDPAQIYEQLKRIYNSSEGSKQNTEVLWRLAKACLRRAMMVSIDDKEKRRAILDQGQSAY